MAKTLIAGLGENSRMKKSMSEISVSQDTLLLASIADRLGVLIAWLGGGNPPESIVESLAGEEKKSDVISYENVDDFIIARYGG